MHNQEKIPSALRTDRLALPEYGSMLGMSVRDAEREIEQLSRQVPYVDLTCADTRRFPPPEWVVEEFVRIARAGGHTYTPFRGDRHVRACVSEHVGNFLGMDVDPEQEIIITSGSQAGLFGAMASVVNCGDRVIIVDPDYLLNERLVRFFGGCVDRIPLIWEDAPTPSLDLDCLAHAMRGGARILFLSHPNNPTGAVFDQETVSEIARLAIENGVIVIIDQLYSRLVYDGRLYFHLAAVKGMKERTVTILGPSKTESMSGYRQGVVVAPPSVISHMEEIQGIASIRAPAYGQHTLVRWLRDDREFVANRVRDYQKARDYALRGLSQSERIRVTPSGGTSYLFPRVVGVEISDQLVAKHLLSRAGVLTSPGYKFGPRGKGHFRICFAQDEAVLADVCARVVDAIGSIAPDD